MNYKGLQKLRRVSGGYERFTKGNKGLQGVRKG